LQQLQDSHSGSYFARCWDDRIDNQGAIVMKFHLLSHGLVGRAGCHYQFLRKVGQTKQSFPPKAQGRTRRVIVNIFKGTDFAGSTRVSQKRPRRQRDTTTIIRDLNDIKALIEQADCRSVVLSIKKGYDAFG